MYPYKTKKLSDNTWEYRGFIIRDADSGQVWTMLKDGTLDQLSPVGSMKAAKLAVDNYWSLTGKSLAQHTRPPVQTEPPEDSGSGGI